MLNGLNLNNLNVDSNGKVSFSGLTSGIDLQGTVDAIIAARHIPIDTLQTTVQDNSDKIDALKELRTDVQSLQTSLSKLYGQVSFGNNNDIFSAKQAYASTTRVDGQTPAAAGNLVGVTVDNSASTGDHSIEVLQTAKSHKISSDQVADPNAAVGFGNNDQFTITSDKYRTTFQSSVASAGSDQIGSAGTLEFTDENGNSLGTVSYLATDTLSSLASAISSNISGVSATITSVPSGVRLSLTGDTGFRMKETGAGTALTDFELGVKKFTVSSSTSLLDLRDLINQANSGNNATGVSASVVTVTASESYLVLTATDTGVTMTLANTNGTPLDTVGLLENSNTTGNSLLHSEEFDNGYWTVQQGSISADSTVAPDGTMTADGIVANTTATTHPVYTASQQSITSGTSYIYSTYAKAGDKNTVRLQVNGTGFGGAEYAEFDLANGVVSGSPSAGVAATDIQSVGNGWYRISMKVTGTANGSSIFEAYPVDATTNFAGDGSTVNTYLWGSQLEEVTTATTPSTYVSTTVKIKNQLQAARKAELYADDIRDQSNTTYESDFQTSSAAEVGSTGTLSFNDGALGTVSYTDTTTLADLATAITTNVTGVTAEVVTDGAGVRLKITGSSAFTMKETGGGSAQADLGIDNSRKVIERSSNTIDDLFAGVTLSLYAAEKGTTVSLQIEQDLSQVKTEIVNFVDAYNKLRQFVNSNKLTDPSTGQLSANAGVLSNSSALDTVETSLAQIIGAGVPGADPNFTVLSQIGVNFVSLGQDDPLNEQNLQVDENKLDAVLLSNPDDVKKLFSFNLTSSDPRVTLLGFDQNTHYNASGYTLNLQPTSGDNLLQYSEALDNGYWTVNAGTVNADAAVAPDGTTTADAVVADATNATHTVYPTTSPSVTSGTSYIFSTYAKAGDKDSLFMQVNGAPFGGAQSAEFDLVNGTVTGTPSAGVEATNIENMGDGWYRVSMKVTASADGTATFERAPKDSASGTPQFTGDGSTANTYLWGGQLEAVTTETTPGNYIPTSYPVGNLFNYSEQADNAYWTPTNATISADSTTAPDGTTTADGVVGDATATAHYLSTTTPENFIAGNNYIFSTYAKAGDQNSARVEFNGTAFGGAAGATFDLTTGTVTSTDAGVSDTSVEDVGGGWYRISIKATATATSTANARRYAGDGTPYSGDGSTVNTSFWGAQLEGADTATKPATYVSTTSAPATSVSATANIDGATDGSDDGSASITNDTLTVESGDAKGLRLFLNGFNMRSSIQLDLTVGVAAQMKFRIDQLLDTATGIVEGEISQLTDQNKLHNERITEMEDRLAIQKKDLTDRYNNMETALARANQIMDSLTQVTNSLGGSSSSSKK